DHTGSNRLAMQPFRIAGKGLNGMTKGVAKVEDRPYPTFSFVGCDYFGLATTGTLNGFCHSSRLQRHQRLSALLKPTKELSILDGTVFNDLGHACSEFPSRESPQGKCVNQYRLGLMKGTGRILAKFMINPGLAANRRVYLGQQCGWHLDECHTALIGGRGITRHVSNHATAQGDQCRVTGMTALQQPVIDTIQIIQIDRKSTRLNSSHVKI